MRGKQPKLSDRQQWALCRVYATRELAEPFSVSRSTVYRALNRLQSPQRTILPPTGIGINAAGCPSSSQQVSNWSPAVTWA